MLKILTLLAGIGASCALAQTQVPGNLIFQGSIDASGAARTAPIRSGTTANRPMTCSGSEMYLATDAPAGDLLNVCSSGTWVIASQHADAANASNITSGTLGAARLPFALLGGRANVPTVVTPPSPGCATLNGSGGIDSTGTECVQATTTNVRAYGAAGDGTTNDVAAIQAAIDATPAGGKVEVPPGNYYLSGGGAELIRISKAIKLECAGWGNTKFTASGSATTDVIHVVGPVQGLVIRDCVVQAAANGTARHGINLDATGASNGVAAIRDFLIEHNFIGGYTVNFGGAAIATTFPTYTDGVYNGTIRYNLLGANAGQYAIKLDRSGDTLNVSHNTLAGAGGNIYLNSAGTAIGPMFIQNALVACQGVLVAYAYKPLFSKNNVEPQPGCSNVGAVISVTGSSGSPILGASFVDNDFSMTPGIGITNAITVDYCHDCTFDNRVGLGTASQDGYVFSSAHTVRPDVVLRGPAGTTEAHRLVRNLPADAKVRSLLDKDVKANEEWFYSAMPGGETRMWIMNGDGQSLSPFTIFRAPRDAPAFTGSGLNDLSAAGIYTSGTDTAFCVQVDGTGGTDTFKWGTDGCATFPNTAVAITGYWQTLASGIAVRFSALTGHTVGDRWQVAAYTTGLSKNARFSVTASGTVAIQANQAFSAYDPTNNYAQVPMVRMDVGANVALGSLVATGTPGVTTLNANGVEALRVNGSKQLIVGAFSAPSNVAVMAGKHWGSGGASGGVTGTGCALGYGNDQAGRVNLSAGAATCRVSFSATYTQIACTLTGSTTAVNPVLSGINASYIDIGVSSTSGSVYYRCEEVTN